MNNVHFAIPEIYGDSLSYYEVLRELIEAMNVIIDNYDTIPEQIADAVKNLDAAQLFSAVLDQLIDTIATDNTKSANAVKMYKKHDLLYATFNDTVNLYESLIDFPTGTETELIPDTNIREVNISELFIELRKLIDNEAQTREQGDNNLQNAINTEKSAREQGDTALQNAVNNEKSAREQADTVLQNAVNNEKSAREQADTVLQTNINNEARVRVQADQNLQNIIENGTIKVDTLWTNATPTSEFVSQNIHVELSGYKFVYISFNESVLNATNIINEFIINVIGKQATSLQYLNSKTSYSRGFTITNDGVYFGDERSNSYDGPIENNHLIPTHIYGIK